MTNRHVPQRLAILISGAGSTMRAVLDAAQADEHYGAQPVVVISDKPDAAGLAIAASAGVPTEVVNVADFPDREAWNQALAATIARYEPDLVLCAGFMRILGAPVLEVFGGRIINTHPALLPSFPGAHAVRDAIAHGVKVTGCTVMMVDAGVDTGPIIAQAVVEVRDNDTQDSLHDRIKAVERDLVATTVGRMAREGWTINGRRVELGGRD
ncbi:phosphoribosylglycinamide formyltransferase [Demequina sp. B12]|uniref:phosphoribosylglycinamide formyltransferase n=1 Tax=Demequina sp. B12 TaxID=2992757 RepID=UPI00237AB6B9|nr:phosphoribosylglycinamide formyltransferase [Demequina sp. B12]MDE0572519.1 phosphoribosylglycinamide formyltransferase [Demequina sp. B12]